MIIVSSDLQNKFEDEYIINLIIPTSSNIVKVNPEKFFELDKNLVKNSKLIIIYSPSSKEINEEIDSFLNEVNLPYVLIHLSDENLEGENKHYKNADFVLRSYFDPRVRKRENFTIPLGFQNGYLSKKDVLIKHKRKYIWSFFGQIYSTRTNMINSLKSLNPHYLHITEGFMSSDALSPKNIIRIYEETIFAPCPFGFINPDSFRIMEVLEYGCIPIVQKFNKLDYYKYIFGDHPFIVVKNWKEAPDIISHYLSNPQLLKEKQIEVSKWYKNFKNQLEQDMNNLFEGKIDLITSKQFIYQNQKGLNYLRNFAFFYWFKLRKKSWFIIISKFMYKVKKFIKRIFE